MFSKQKYFKFLAITLIVFISVCWVTKSYATSCLIPKPEERILQNAIIFEGTPISEKPIANEISEKRNSHKKIITTFKVLKIYKGDIGDTIDIISTEDSFDKSPEVKLGHSYIIFTGSHRILSYCNPPINLTYA